MSTPPYKKLTKTTARALVGKSVVFVTPMVGVTRNVDESASLFSIHVQDCALILECHLRDGPNGLSALYTLLLNEKLVEFDGRRFFRSWTEKTAPSKNPCAEVYLGSSAGKPKKPRSKIVKMTPAVVFLD